MSGKDATMDMSAAAPAPASKHTEQYLSFLLGGEECGVEISRVQEIKGWDTVTRVPHTPNYMLGVINLRGSIVPIIDLRIRFGLELTVRDMTTVIIVVRIAAERGERIVGMVVDAVADVYDIEMDKVRKPPEALGLGAAFLKGLADRDGKLLILIDVERLVASSIAGADDLAA